MKLLNKPPSRGREKNTYKLAAMQLLKSLFLVTPVIALFFTQHGLSLTQITLLQSAFSIALFTMEIPTGYISDRYGRKTSLIVGYAGTVIGFLIYWQSSTFGQFLMAELFLACALACISGSDSALLYDTLKSGGKAELAKKREGRLGFASNIAGIISGAIGGFIGAHLGFSALWLLSALFVAIGLIIACTLEEVRQEMHEDRVFHLGNDLRTLKTQFTAQPRLLWLMLFSGIVSYASYSLVRSQQQWLQQLGAPVAWFGIIWGIARMCIAGGGLSAHRYDGVFGHKKGLGGLLLGMLGAFAILAIGGHWMIAFLGLCLAFLINGIRSPLVTYYLNEQVADSSLRATTLSSMSMIHRMIFAAILPLQGWIGDTYGYQAMFLAMLCLFALAGGRSWRKLTR